MQKYELLWMYVCANIFKLGKTTFILIPRGFSIEASRTYIYFFPFLCLPPQEFVANENGSITPIDITCIAEQCGPEPRFIWKIGKRDGQMHTVQPPTIKLAPLFWRLLEALKIYLQTKVGWVLKTSGNSLSNRHWNFSIWNKGSKNNWV